ncbi:MAG: DUF2726 domain-containing protein [Desulfuromonadales bacterium]|nr:DUF2726 domain-containing protein [Desulfuromonadales bacterium]
MFEPIDLALVVLGLLLVITGTALLLRRPKRPRPAEYEAVPVLSAVERSFLGRLETAAGAELRILVKVGLPALLVPASGLRSKRQRLLALRLQPHRIDFLLCRAADLTVHSAISLCGEAKTRQELQQLLTVVDIPCLSFPPDDLPSLEELRARLAALNTASAPDSGDWALGTAEWLGLEQEADEWQIVQPRRPPAPAKPADASILCPECGSAMIRRRMARGPHAGGEFWVCPNYPDCRRMIPTLGN